jgi:hypothetical protein
MLGFDPVQIEAPTTVTYAERLRSLGRAFGVKAGDSREFDMALTGVLFCFISVWAVDSISFCVIYFLINEPLHRLPLLPSF